MVEDFFYSVHTIQKLFGIHSFDYDGDLISITTSSKEAKKNSLFIPLKAERDGHEFIEDAFSNGAILAIAEIGNPILRKLPEEILRKLILVKNTYLALGEIASFHRLRFKPFVIGITGSSGKTTTKEIFTSIALELGKKNIISTEKNYNNEIGVPFTLFKITSNTKLVICEMGMNHKGEISRLTKMVQPDIAMITNIGPCHIENLKSIEGIARAKAEIIEGMKPGSKLFIPKSTEFLSLISQIAKRYSIKVCTFDFNTSKVLKVLETKSDGFKLKLYSGSLVWNLPGRKILENISGIIELLNSIDFDKNKILSGLQKFKAADKRFVIENNFYKVINDTYNANPDSMKSSIDAVEQLASEKKFFLVLGDMKELGKFSKKYHSEIGKFISTKNCSTVFSFGTDSKWITENVDKTILRKHFSIDSLDELLDSIRKLIPKNAYLLIKGSRSMKMEKIVERLRHVR